MNIYDHFAHEDEYPELNIEAMSERLAKALSFKTVYTDAETTDWSQFDALQQHIVDSFPYVMTAASNVEVVGHSLLIEISGSNHELPALMLIAHQDVVPVVPGTFGDVARLISKTCSWASLRHLSICSHRVSRQGALSTWHLVKTKRS